LSTDSIAVPPAAPVVGASGLSDALDAVESFMARFIYWPDEHCGPMAALWAAHTHVAGVFYHTPRLVVTALTPESGKTRVLEVLGVLCSEPLRSSSLSAASMFAAIEQGGDGVARPTFLMDEVDKSMDTEQTVILNDGYKADGVHVRTQFAPDGTRMIQRFRTFAPVALAGLSDHRLAEDLLTRCIRVGMERKPRGAAVERFSGNWHRAEGGALRTRLAGALAPHAGALSIARPVLPEGLGDRAWDIWEPLIAIADAAGGAWPDRARAACLHFATGRRRRSEMTLAELLIRDLRTLCDEFAATNGSIRFAVRSNE